MRNSDLSKTDLTKHQLTVESVELKFSRWMSRWRHYRRVLMSACICFLIKGDVYIPSGMRASVYSWFDTLSFYHLLLYVIVQNMLKHGSIFVVFLCVLKFGTGLYFHIGETERKCFIEEIPDDTTVLGKVQC